MMHVLGNCFIPPHYYAGDFETLAGSLKQADVAKENVMQLSSGMYVLPSAVASLQQVRSMLG